MAITEDVQKPTHEINDNLMRSMIRLSLVNEEQIKQYENNRNNRSDIGPFDRK